MIAFGMFILALLSYINKK
ncbi:putative holin-like toxin [Bacillus sp. CLL-7-23]|nr:MULTISPECIES: putative holin-like toxin [Bacillus]MDA7027558.1 putative holin-like toxin [Bacillus changyiensis]MDA7028611.1 putative holin-like toxin [Bacillus changyiensis]